MDLKLKIKMINHKIMLKTIIVSIINWKMKKLKNRVINLV